MGKIIYIMGKSSSGKDTIFKKLLGDVTLSLKTIVSYTTRPIRKGEKNGEEYFFTDEEGFQRLKSEGKVIEDRCYQTVHGPWRYFTVDDGQINDTDNCITIGTIESYSKICDYYGKEKLIPVLIELDDGVRLERALNRERKQTVPKYEEMCRRFLADANDFSEERISAAGIERRFENTDLHKCLDEIKGYVVSNME